MQEFHIQINDLYYLTRVDTKRIPETANLYSNDVNEKELIQISANQVHELLQEFKTLPREQINGEYVRELPERKTLLQREKSLPKPKELTTWQKFAIKKGIKKNRDKKQRLVYDEESKQYMSRYQLKKLQKQRTRK